MPQCLQVPALRERESREEGKGEDGEDGDDETKDGDGEGRGDRGEIEQHRSQGIDDAQE